VLLLAASCSAEFSGDRSCRRVLERISWNGSGAGRSDFAAQAETGQPGRTLCSKRMELDMDHDTKHEIVVLTLSTLAAIPVVASLGLAVVTGILAW
jgi:hypothetical protein